MKHHHHNCRKDDKYNLYNPNTFYIYYVSSEKNVSKETYYNQNC